MQIYILVSALLLHTNNAVRNTSQLKFSFITSLTGDFVASGGITAVDIALEQINGSPEILPNYTLGYTDILDSNVNGLRFNANTIRHVCMCMAYILCISCAIGVYTMYFQISL